MILNGVKIADQIKEQIKIEVANLKKQNITPKLVVIQIGNENASNVYIRNKKRAMEEVGIQFELKTYKESTKEDELIKEIEALNQDPTVHGILIQSPLPKHISEDHVFNSVNPKKDVDGFTHENMGLLMENVDGLTPCTPTGIMKLLQEYQIPIEGKHVVIIGRSTIVGKPLALLFLAANASVTILHSKSENLKEITKQADILVSATGKIKMVTKDMVKKGAVVIDVGINRQDDKIVGDVDFEEVKKIASHITPVPKGVGPMTIAILMQNVIKACQQEVKKELCQSK